jgi:hypothetical protein
LFVDSLKSLRLLCMLANNVPVDNSGDLFLHLGAIRDFFFQKLMNTTTNMYSIMYKRLDNDKLHIYNKSKMVQI